MPQLLVSENEESQDAIRANAPRIRAELEARRKKESIQSVITSFLCFGLILAILAVIALFPSRPEIPIIVSYQAEKIDDEARLETKKLTNTAQPRPPGASSSMAKVIASSVPAEISLPVPEVSVPDAFFGMQEDFGPGWGSGDGDGSGGGGASFFGSRRKGKRVVFIVDFSGSMDANTEKGGTRIAALKTELNRAIKDLRDNMQVSVIFFSHNTWTIETEGPEHADNGWNGLGKSPLTNWYPATERYKAQVMKTISSMPTGGGTNWYPPLKMAFGMSPQPNIVYLLSDGDPRDGELVIDEIKEINPQGIPIDTIAFELPGSPAGMLMDIAEKTGGRFTMIHRGKRLTGRSAEQMINPRHDDE